MTESGSAISWYGSQFSPCVLHLWSSCRLVSSLKSWQLLPLEQELVTIASGGTTSGKTSLLGVSPGNPQIGLLSSCFQGQPVDCSPQPLAHSTTTDLSLQPFPNQPPSSPLANLLHKQPTDSPLSYSAVPTCSRYKSRQLLRWPFRGKNKLA